MTKQQKINCRIWGVFSGLMLLTANLYPVLAFAQLAAFVPILFLAATNKINARYMLVYGLYMGLAYTFPQMALLRMTPLIALPLLIYLTLSLMLMSLGVGLLFAKPSLPACFAVAALLAVFDWIIITALPIWGTAQSLVRGWSQYPSLVNFTSITGMTCIIFSLGLFQSLFVYFLVRPNKRIWIAVTTIIFIALLATANIIALNSQPITSIKVAAMGWSEDDYEDINNQKGFDILVARAITQAADQGAKLIVFPEMAFYMNDHSEKCLASMSQLASRHNIFLVSGYINGIANENRMLFMDNCGTVKSEYTKTNLTLFEDYNKGDGRIKTVNLNGICLGGMICHDDNYTTLSRTYGQKPASIVAVPTMDWATVKNAHFQNSIHRAIESRYGVVRPQHLTASAPSFHQPAGFWLRRIISPMAPASSWPICRSIAAKHFTALRETGSSHYALHISLPILPARNSHQ